MTTDLEAEQARASKFQEVLDLGLAMFRRLCPEALEDVTGDEPRVVGLRKAQGDSKLWLVNIVFEGPNPLRQLMVREEGRESSLVYIEYHVDPTQGSEGRGIVSDSSKYDEAGRLIRSGHIQASSQSPMAPILAKHDLKSGVWVRADLPPPSARQLKSR